MQRIQISGTLDFYGQLAVTLEHAGLPEKIVVGGDDPVKIIEDMEAKLVESTKEALRRFLSIVEKSKGPYLDENGKRRLEQLEKVKRGITKRSRLKTVQEKLFINEDHIEFLLSSRKSRFYQSQLFKRDFFQAVIHCDLNHIFSLISSTV